MSKLEEIDPLSLPQSNEEAVKKFAKNVRLVIQTCNEAEYYAALERLSPPQIEDCNFDKPVMHYSIVVGTFAGIDAAIISQNANCKTEFGIVFSTNAKLLLRLGVCLGHGNRSVDLKFADVLVASEIGVSQLGLGPHEKVYKVAPSVHQLFCECPNTWDGNVVCEEPTKRIAKAYVGRLFIPPKDTDEIQDMKYGYWCYLSQKYLGAEIENIYYTPPDIEVVFIKGVASFTKYHAEWQLTAAKAAVDYAHHKLERAGYINFNKF